MDVRYINPFVLAVRDVLDTVLGVEVAMGKPYVAEEQTACADVSAIIGFSGDAAGFVVISFPKMVADRMAMTFARTELADGHPDFADALGEIANRVAGNAKKGFEGVQISLSLPSVIIGDNHAVSRSNAFPRLVVPCETALGPFFVEVGMKIEKGAPVAVS